MSEDYKQIIKKVEPEMEKAFRFLEQELSKIHPFGSLAVLIENIKVPFFGQEFLLKQLGSISVQGSRELVVYPWDKSYCEAIAFAISKSGISCQAVVDKQVVKVTFPPLSEESRKDIIRKVHELAEKTRQTIRKFRERAWDEIQTKQRAGQIREDDKFRAKDELQKLIDKYNEKIKELVEKKDNEIKK